MLITLLLLLAVAFVVGFFFGAHVSGTTIQGLKIAFIIWPAIFFTVIALIIGFFLGETSLFGGSAFLTSLCGASAAHYYQRYFRR